MNFPHTRHYQRYEYIVQAGYIDDMVVADFGCGTVGCGSFLLTSKAKFVYAVDTNVNPKLFFGFNADAHPDRLFVVQDSLYHFGSFVDVVIAIEVFEHMADVQKFINHVASICKYAFFTTPLAKNTGKTLNPQHVLEYSAEDFDKVLTTQFNIVDKVYQRANMGICNDAKPHGSSYNPGHVVQMAWCRSKNGRK